MIAVRFTHSLLSMYVNDITLAVLKKIYVSDDSLFGFYFTYDGDWLCWVKYLNVSYRNLYANSYTNTNCNNCHA